MTALFSCARSVLRDLNQCRKRGMYDRLPR